MAAPFIRLCVAMRECHSALVAGSTLQACANRSTSRRLETTVCERRSLSAHAADFGSLPAILLAFSGFGADTDEPRELC